MITEDQHRHYVREGYLLLPGLIETEAVDAVRDAGRERSSFDSGQWNAIVHSHDEPEKDADVHALLSHPAVADVASTLLGAEARIWYGMFAVVSPGGGHGLPWHQDNMYTQVLPTGLNIFIALETITEERGGLWIAPKSHRRGVAAYSYNDSTAPGHREAAEDPEDGFALGQMNPGDACVFDRHTLHRSSQNRSDQPRFAYAAQYCASFARYAEDGAVPERLLVSELAALREAVRR